MFCVSGLALPRPAVTTQLFRESAKKLRQFVVVQPAKWFNLGL